MAKFTFEPNNEQATALAFFADKEHKTVDELFYEGVNNWLNLCIKHMYSERLNKIIDVIKNDKEKLNFVEVAINESEENIVKEIK